MTVIEKAQKQKRDLAWAVTQMDDMIDQCGGPNDVAALTIIKNELQIKKWEDSQKHKWYQLRKKD